jgi:hypothetical protein
VIRSPTDLTVRAWWHALRDAGKRFHEDNRSGRISRRTATVIRRYTLFAHPLRAEA